MLLKNMYLLFFLHACLCGMQMNPHDSEIYTIGGKYRMNAASFNLIAGQDQILRAGRFFCIIVDVENPWYKALRLTEASDLIQKISLPLGAITWCDGAMVWVLFHKPNMRNFDGETKIFFDSLMGSLDDSLKQAITGIYYGEENVVIDACSEKSLLSETPVLSGMFWQAKKHLASHSVNNQAFIVLINQSDVLVLGMQSEHLSYLLVE